MGKISPEEKIQWVEKIIQNKESIRSVASKTGTHHMTVDKWLRNYKSIGPKRFPKKDGPKELSQKRKLLFSMIFPVKVLSEISAINTKLQTHISSETGL